MALQTSGVISLNDIHVEAGGPSGGACAINDSDIRALINKGSGAAMNFAEWYGASASETFTVTVGTRTADYEGTSYGYGYLHGSVSPTTSDTFGGANVSAMNWTDFTDIAGLKYVYLVISGTQPNSGWTTYTVGSSTYTRASAVYESSSVTTWRWETNTNPFGTTVGATRTVVIA